MSDEFAQLSAPTGSTHTVRWAVRIAAGFAALLLVGATLRLWANDHAARTLEREATERLLHSVSVVQARSDGSQRKVQLPATLRGYEEALIYARTGGYVSRWHREIGDHVQKDEVLATLSAPELTQELQQARAAREQSRARAAFAATSLKRWEAQREFHVVSQQQFEEKRSEAQQAEADLAAAQANVQRLENVLALQQVKAPFAGVITRRRIDTGALVLPGTTELFAMAQVDRLRLTVWVPQTYASDVHEGQQVSVSVNGVQRSFTGLVEHVSGAIDVNTRSRQVEIAVPNADGSLLPGAYAEVGFDLATGVGSLLIPPGVLIVNKDGPRVMVVGEDDRIALRPIRLGRDLGREIEVLQGITVQDRLVINPADLLREGDLVSVRPGLSSQKTIS